MLDVDITVRRGTFSLVAAFRSDAPIVALFGRSGSGKSTIVEAVAGTVAPQRGRVVIGDRVLYDSGSGIDLAPERRRVGCVFQDGLLFPHLDVRANLAYGERLTPAPERFIDSERVIALLGIASLLDRRPANLSGGEKQRVAIGRALLTSPRILLLDEPLASLDGPRKAEILAYVELLRDELRLPMVYVSHAIEEVTRIADRVVVIAEGAVVADGDTVDALSRPAVGALAGRREEGAIIDARVASHDPQFGLSTLAFEGGELVVPNVDALPGEPVRVRIRARDVSLSLGNPGRVSIQNVLEVDVISLGGEFGAIIDVALRVGTTPLVARITRKAASELGIAPGMKVHALVKAVSIDRRSVGFA